MSNQSVITSIVKLYKLITLITDVDINHFPESTNNSSVTKLKNQQTKLEILNHKLFEGFSWYCGSSMKLVAKNISNYNTISFPSTSAEYLSLIRKAGILNTLIDNSIVANYNYKNLFSEIGSVIENKIELVDEEFILESDIVLSTNL